MAVINSVVQLLVDWVRAQELTPMPREVVSVGALPPAAFPSVAVQVLEERQSGPGGSFSATLALTVSYALGRPADAQATVRDLAHQLRRAINQSHNLGGSVASITVAGIRHSAELMAAAEPQVLARSELLLHVAYDEQQL